MPCIPSAPPSPPSLEPLPATQLQSDVASSQRVQAAWRSLPLKGKVFPDEAVSSQHRERMEERGACGGQSRWKIRQHPSSFWPHSEYALHIAEPRTCALPVLQVPASWPLAGVQRGRWVPREGDLGHLGQHTTRNRVQPSLSMTPPHCCAGWECGEDELLRSAVSRSAWHPALVFQVD